MSRRLGIHSAVWDGSGELLWDASYMDARIYWTGQPPWGPSHEMTEAALDEVADVAVNGGIAAGGTWTIPAGSNVVLDMEHPNLETMGAAELAEKLAYFKAAAPGIKFTIYGLFFFGTLNHGDWQTYNPTTQAIVEAALTEYGPAIELMDFLPVGDFYLLEQVNETRDYAYFTQVCASFRQFFPTKPIIPFVWGRRNYGVQPALTAGDIDTYVANLAAICDGLMPWGPEADNTLLAAALRERRSLLLPAARTINWANRSYIAMHSYTLTSLQNAVKHALGKTPDSLTSLAEIVNDAIQAFCNLHNWSWLEGNDSLDFEGGQSYVDLPADFHTLKTIQVTSTNGFQLEPATMQRITDLRKNTTASPVGGLYLYTIKGQTQATVTALPTARIELWPTPSADLADAIAIGYRRGINKLTSGTDVPDVPAMFHFALKKYVRAHALQEDGQEGAESEMASAMLQVQQLIKLDAQTQPSLGTPRPGVIVQGRQLTSIRPGDSITI